MKILKKLIFILIVTGILFSCNEEEFLDEEPVTSISTKSYFKTSNHFEEAVNGAYASLHGVVDQNYPITYEMRSDNSTFQFNNINRSDNWLWFMDQFIAGSDNGIASTNWYSTYDGIRKCNEFMHFVEDKEFENKARYIAEIKYLRGFYYFHLVRCFGDVPLVTKKIESYDEAFEQNKRTPKQEVYEQIVSDLNDAKENLPKNYSAEDQGRATEGAARTLLAKVLMWLDQYGDAASELEEVVNSGEYALLDDYSSVFDIDNENNEEMIFSVQYIQGPYGLDNWISYRYIPWNSGNEYISHGANVARGGHNAPTEDLIESFENNDERLSMIDTSWIDQERGFYHDSIVPFTRKYMHPGHSTYMNTGSNIPVFRYPHVLLMLAECYVREGGGDPVSLVNQVRERSGLEPLSDVTLDDIIHERRVEFHCESDRWDVLVRTEKAKEVMEAHGEEQRQRPNIGSEAYKNVKLLYPIPIDVIELDPSIEQNPGYE